jgi:site-specific DNA-cytosine methylase
MSTTPSLTPTKTMQRNTNIPKEQEKNKKTPLKSLSYTTDNEYEKTSSKHLNPHELSLPTRTINRTAIKTVRHRTNTQATKKTPRLLKIGTHSIIEIRPNNRRTTWSRVNTSLLSLTSFSTTHFHKRLLKFLIPVTKLIR